MMTLTIRLDKDSLKFRPEDGKLYFTYQDIQSLPEWPASPLIELSNGELFAIPSPSTRHQEISGNLFFLLKQIVLDNDLGLIFTAPTDVKLLEEDIVIPDIVFIEKGREGIVKDQFIDDAPDLIVEILSTNKRRDTVEKFEIYQKYEIQEYIIVDPQSKQINHFILDNEKKYREITTKDNMLEIHTLNRNKIDLDNIFN